MSRLNILSAFLLLLFLFVSRLYLLNIVPATLTHDETVYAIQAYSYFVQGESLDQNQSMWKPIPVDNMYAEYPSLLLMSGFLFTNNALLASHLIPALLGIAFPLVFGSLTYGIWKDKISAIIATIVSAFNPLLWQLSRMSYDAFFSAFFYVCGAAILVNCKNRFKLLSIPLFIFGFFQYQGFKLLLFPWIIIIVMMKFLSTNGSSFENIKQKINLNEILRSSTSFIVLFSLFLTFFYAFILLPMQPSNDRLQSMIFFDTPYLSETVNNERKLSLLSPITSFMANKMTVSVDFILKRLIGTFNPNLLFLNIEPAVSGFFVWTHGLFYWIEGIGIIVGMYFMFSDRKKRILGTATIMGILLLNVPNLINTMSEWYTLRGLLSYLLLLIVASFGLMKLWSVKKLRIAILLLYLISIFNFTYQYFYRYPVIGLDAGNFDERIIAKYIDLHTSKHPDIALTIYGDEPNYLFYNYLLYSDALNKNSVDNAAKTFKENKNKIAKSYSFKNIIFTNECVSESKDGVVIRSIHYKNCTSNNSNIKEVNGESKPASNEEGQEMLSIVAVKDSGIKYRIYNDSVCGEQNAGGFIHLQSLNQLKIEELSESDFCKNWITKVN